jgi:NAD(P)H-dependent FMN reductase
MIDHLAETSLHESSPRDPDRPMTTPAVAIVVGSTRPGRICRDVADWVLGTVRESVSPLRYELLDLAEIDLPFLDEPVVPAYGGYVHEHTLAWSRRVNGYDGFVFVFPQYNWGYPAVLKNALDFLYSEWHGKPAGIVTYGKHGGGKAAEQLRLVLAGLHMAPAGPPALLTVTAADTDSAGRLVDPERTFAVARPDLRALDRRLAGLLATGRAGDVRVGGLTGVE